MNHRGIRIFVFWRNRRKSLRKGQKPGFGVGNGPKEGVKSGSITGEIGLGDGFGGRNWHQAAGRKGADWHQDAAGSPTGRIPPDEMLYLSVTH